MSNDNAVYSKCPVVKEENIKLLERVVVGSGKIAFVPFTQKLMWLRESEAHISYWHNNKVFKEGSTFNDYYGFLTSYQNALDELQDTLKHFAIDEYSSLEVRIYVSIDETPVLEDNSSDGKTWNTPNTKHRRYQSLSGDKYWCYDSPEHIQEYLSMLELADQSADSFDIRFKASEIIETLRVEKKTIAKDVLVWSSKNNPDVVSFDVLKATYE